MSPHLARCLAMIAGFVPLAGAGLTKAADASQPPPAPPTGGLLNDWLERQSASASPWNLGGEFRLRYEVRQDAGSYPSRDFLGGLDNSNDYLLFRTKAHLGWTPASWFTAFVQGRDAHAVGDSRPVTETDRFDLHQAYMVLGDAAAFPLVFKIGRQELSYHERYVGLSEWSNLGRSFDAARLRFEKEAFWADVFTGRQVISRDGHFNVANDYDWFSGIYASASDWIPWQETSLYFLARNVSDGSLTAISSTLGGPGPRDIVTVGTRWESRTNALGPWKYVFEAAGQFGSIQQDDSRQDHRAFAINAHATHTWKDAFGAPVLGAGYDFGTGDDDPADDRNETLDLLFGTNHRLYGLMDLFGPRNMHIPRVFASLKPAPDVSVSLEYLGFWIANTTDYLYPESAPGRSQNGYGRHPEYASYVGSELDLLIHWSATPWAQVQAGYGHFFAGDYLRDTAGAVGRDTRDADWFFLQVRVRF